MATSTPDGVTTDELEDLLATLPELVHRAAEADRALHSHVELLRSRRATWTEIGKALGVSRQAAWQRFCRSDGSAAGARRG